MPTKKASTTKTSTRSKAKSAAKKTTSKKSPTPKNAAASSTVKSNKKSASSTAAKPATGRALVCATGSDCFWVHDGPILKDLVELADALAEMPEKMFAHHVGGARHDFAQWVEHVLKDAETAAALRKAKKPATAHKVVVKQLKLYNLPG